VRLCGEARRLWHEEEKSLPCSLFEWWFSPVAEGSYHQVVVAGCERMDGFPGEGSVRLLCTNSLVALDLFFLHTFSPPSLAHLCCFACVNFTCCLPKPLSLLPLPKLLWFLICTFQDRMSRTGFGAAEVDISDLCHVVIKSELISGLFLVWSDILLTLLCASVILVDLIM